MTADDSESRHVVIVVAVFIFSCLALQEEIAEELLNGGVCGFTILHFAAFAGKYRAVQVANQLNRATHSWRLPRPEHLHSRNHVRL
eukprot:5670329-Amphidinium_carterae.1